MVVHAYMAQSKEFKERHPRAPGSRACSATLKPAASLGTRQEVCCEDGCGPSSQAPAVWAAAWGGSVSGGSQLSPEVLRGGLIQPLGVHHAEVSHVALVGVEQLSVHDAGRLAVEEDG